MDRLAEEAEHTEDERRAERQAEGEGGRGQREGSSSVMARGTHGADHREASGRPCARQPDEQPRQRERSGQHLIFVS